MSYVQRVADRAADFDLVRALLSVLAAPFYLVGLLAGVLLAVLAWCWAGVLVGVADVRERS